MAHDKRVAVPLRSRRHPVVYEVNARVLVNELPRTGARKRSLSSVPESVMDGWARLGFDAIWLMGVWSTGDIGLEIARSHAGLNDEYRKVLPDLREEDIGGSPYAVRAYEVSPALGGNDALRTFRARLAERGIGLLLDFICNHTARDHEWILGHPEYYVLGSQGDDTGHPDMFFKTRTAKGDRVVAFGRDPMFPGWTDTAQINHAHSGARGAMVETLKEIAGMCDGVRCDMAMLALRSVFERTWGEKAAGHSRDAVQGEFWKEAIAEVRKIAPDFLFMAEAYWNLEWELQQLGFDFTYDKTLYDRLLREGAVAVHDHLKAEMAYQRRSVRFIENHDEQRAAAALPSHAWHGAAAVVISTVPGMVLLHEGQLEGRTIKLPVQLVRRPVEPASPRLRAFYERLTACIHHPVFENGEWKLLQTRPGWHDNYTWQNFLVFWWQDPSCGARLVVINYAPLSGQCYVDFPMDMLEGTPLEFRDLLSEAVYVRDRGAIASKGMYFDLSGYGIHLFEVFAGRKSAR